MGIDEPMRSWVRNRLLPARSCELGTDDSHKPLTSFLYLYFLLNLHRSKVFSSKPFLLFLLEMTWFHCAAAAVSEKNLATEVIAIWYRALQFKDGPLALLSSAQRHTD